MMVIVFYLIIGILAGFLGGLFGIGGGILTLPALLFTFHLYHFPNDHLMQLTLGTTLAAMVFTAASSAISHAYRKGVVWSICVTLSPGIFLGAIFGALIANSLTNGALEGIVGVFELLIGIYFFIFDKEEVEAAHIKKPSVLLFTILGVFIGTLSTILGIGGGIITVPILTSLGVSMKKAIATSAATGFLIALIGAITFFVLGNKGEGITSGMGYIYFPAFITIGIASVLSAPWGAKLAYHAPTKVLRKAFGVVLCLIACFMIYGAFTTVA